MQKNIKFTKMHGLGNDFVMLENEEFLKSGMTYSELSKKLCDRRFGIGADGIIVINPEEMRTSDADIAWMYYNSDGTPAQMCGNGMRCFAKYVYEKGHIKKKQFKVNTFAGIKIPEILANGEIKVNMGAPFLKPQEIPFKGDSALNFEIKAGDKTFKANAVSMGNPHCLIFSDDDTEELAINYGPIIEKHELFPEKTNVEFIKVLSRSNIKIDVWERGCGITQACGTGACASVVASILNNLTDNCVKADLPGGSLTIEWQGSSENNNENVFMTGKAETVFWGEYML